MLQGAERLFQPGAAPPVVVGSSGLHAVLYVPRMTERLREAVARWGRIQNPEALREGFNLARGICRDDLPPPGNPDEAVLFDDLRIVSAEDVTIESEDDTRFCLDFH